jgi:hypothetical protein
MSALTPANLHFVRRLPLGWRQLYLLLLDALPDGTEISYAGEAGGAMRVWPQGSPEGVSEILTWFSQRSMQVCAGCGAPAQVTERQGHSIPYCPEHARMRGYAPAPVIATAPVTTLAYEAAMGEPVHLSTIASIENGDGYLVLQRCGGAHPALVLINVSDGESAATAPWILVTEDAARDLAHAIDATLGGVEVR